MPPAPQSFTPRRLDPEQLAEQLLHVLVLLLQYLGRDDLEFQLVEVNTLAFADNTRYEFRMSVETLTDHTRFHLEMDPKDGTHVLEYEDFSPNRFTAGRAGLRKKHGPDACWDDLTVAALGGLPSRAKPDPATPGASQTPGGGQRLPCTHRLRATLPARRRGH